MRRAPQTGRRYVNEVSPENAPDGIAVRPLFETSLGNSKKTHPKEHAELGTNNFVMMALELAVTVPKQPERPLIEAMSCPLLLERQHDPNDPASFAAHIFSNVALRAAKSTSSPDAQARTVARSRNKETQSERFIFWFGKMEEIEKAEKKSKRQ